MFGQFWKKRLKKIFWIIKIQSKIVIFNPQKWPQSKLGQF